MNNREALTEEIAKILFDDDVQREISDVAIGKHGDKEAICREHGEILARELDKVGVEADIERYGGR